MALGTRYPYGRRSDSGAPMNERWVRAVRSRPCLNAESNLEALPVRKFCDPWSVFSPSMASFLRRLVDALSRVTNRIVLDKTGLKGTYDIDLQYTPEFVQLPEGGAGVDAPPVHLRFRQ
jgi:uncharacterized protein (TIGR03435 family)